MTSTTPATNSATSPQSAEDTFDVRPSSHPRTAEERAEVLSDLGFGVAFTDHMARATWTSDAGWHDRRIEAYAPLQLDPAAAVLHYAQEIFEGLKAYAHADGSVWAFRPEANARRFARSARRLALPELPEEDFLASIRALVHTDVEWVPTSSGASMYLRPFMFASEAFLGVRPAKRVEYLVIASPVGPYFTRGFTPVSIWVSEEYHRAGPGGTGEAKCGGNYAASLLPQQEAYAHGCDQVCFLDSSTNTLLEELGGMNLFVVGADGVVSTPRLSGTILEGVTRSSILELLGEQGHEVRERDIPLAEVLDGVASGAVTEVFACGTAAVVTPVGRLASARFDVSVADGAAGAVTTAIHTALTDVQFGVQEDTHGWMQRLV
ncbi:branched-chain amino acid aminotransferase [Beutenbergia cavernae DSM 12333]|uniref:Branched-chain-amino-acid aminotransferase n=1 Tax=Beutenbergia cavernae (strain ATCC BAA-8 / DSM 12333 / CCUG 43141 / JCM 11478 / NBRC 16432 / NCIMB 13614 / HKI 0122) TaxID=471853 RepID=C5C2J0_BEUC1|nr:branched-chain amino acid aminotransferase [Beutenbergia cavernae]ACQ79676.1 branched-chain amino acid aminotransferase [Beutenbergia cavernae DSM 12333]